MGKIMNAYNVVGTPEGKRPLGRRRRRWRYNTTIKRYLRDI